MRIISYNVNGLAAAIRKGLLKHIATFDADVVCLQEVRSDIPLNLPGYQQFWNLATRKGYSGTLMLTKKLPERVVNGIGVEHFDIEGRVITADFGSFYLTLSILRNLADPHPANRSPYYELQMYFHYAKKSLFSLTIQQIEEIIGFQLGYEAWCAEPHASISEAPWLSRCRRAVRWA